MGLISHELPNLLGGISQQAPSVRGANQLEDCRNALPDPVLGLVKRMGTEHKRQIGDFSGADPFMYTCNREGNSRHSLIITNDDGVTFPFMVDQDGNYGTLHRNNAMIDKYLSSATPAVSYSAVSVADTIFLLNKDIKVLKSADLSAVRPKEGIIYAKGVNYSVVYSVTITKGVETKTLNFKTKANTQPDIAQAQIAETGANTDNMLKMFYYYFNSDSANYTVLTPYYENVSDAGAAGSLPANMAIGMEGSTLFVYNINGDTTDFTLTVTDTSAGNHLVGFKDEVASITDLPNMTHTGFEIKVRGKNSDNSDDYWVVSQGTGWKETIEQGVAYQFDVTTMPIQFRMDNAGEWHMEYVTWATRIAGNDFTNPWPSFVDTKINCIKVYKDRLVFLSGANYSMSRLASWDAFDFFRIVTLTILDTDPIDGSVTADDTPTLYHAVDFTNSLLLFGEFLQFKITSQGPLTPNTITVSSTTEFTADPKVKPKGAGKFVFFSSHRGDFGSLWEFSVEAGVSSFNASLDNANEITNHASKLLAGAVTSINMSPNNSMAFVTTDAKLNELYVYKYLWSDQGKTLSSWVIWEFSGDIAGVSVAHDVVTLLIKRDGKLNVETISINKDSAFTDTGQKILLDRRVKLTAGVRTRTPYNTPEEVVYINQKGVQVTSEAKDLLLAAGENVWAGVRFVYKVILSKAFYVSNNQNVVGGKLQMKKYYIQYADSGYFKVVKNNTTTKEFNGKIFSNPEYFSEGVTLTSGIFQVAATGLNDRCQIAIENASHLACSVVAARWEAYYITRSQNI